jgi:hypothetical protein
MPKRPRSHQLEDLSKNRFRELLPPSWVARDKSHDYGIDLEVEIFGQDSAATGLTFFVQLRATDSLQKGMKLRLSREQHDYFHALNVPTVVVRFCAADGAFYWRWHYEIPRTADDRQLQTVTFSERNRWTASTTGEIEAALRTYRALKQHPSADPVLICGDARQLPAKERYAFLSAVRQAVNATSALSEAGSKTSGSLVISIEGLVT